MIFVQNSRKCKLVSSDRKQVRSNLPGDGEGWVEITKGTRKLRLMDDVSVILNYSDGFRVYIKVKTHQFIPEVYYMLIVPEESCLNKYNIDPKQTPDEASLCCEGWAD